MGSSRYAIVNLGGVQQILWEGQTYACSKQAVQQVRRRAPHPPTLPPPPSATTPPTSRLPPSPRRPSRAAS